MDVRMAMTSPAIVVKPRDSVRHARELLEKYRVNQLPVVVDGTVVGIVTDRDVRDAFPSVLEIYGRRRGRKPSADVDVVQVEDIMSRSLLTISPDEPLEQAARLLRRERIGALPVVEHGRLAGILSRSDVLDAYLDRATEVAAARHPAAESKAPAGASEEVRRNW